MSEVSNMKLSESALKTAMNYRSYKRNNTINKISQRLNNKILAELRIKVAEIYNKLYVIKNSKGNTLSEIFDDADLNNDNPDIEKYLELIIESRMIEEQINFLHNNSFKLY